MFYFYKHLERTEYSLSCFRKMAPISRLIALPSKLSSLGVTVRATLCSSTPYSFFTLHLYSPESLNLAAVIFKLIDADDENHLISCL